MSIIWGAIEWVLAVGGYTAIGIIETLQNKQSDKQKMKQFEEEIRRMCPPKPGNKAIKVSPDPDPLITQLREDLQQCERHVAEFSLCSYIDSKFRLPQVLVTKLCSAVKETQTLRFLNCNSSFLKGDRVRMILEAVQQSKSPNLTKLDISQNKINDEELKFFDKFFENNDKITTLRMGYHYFSEDGIKMLANSLKKDATITDLSLAGVCLRENGLEYLADYLNSNNSLKILDISTKTIEDATSASFGLFLQSLTNHSSITHLDLGFNRLDDERIDLLCIFLANDHNLKYLNLSYTYIGPEKAKRISDSLGTNKTLTCLDLASINLYSAKDWKSFMELLKYNQTITIRSDNFSFFAEFFFPHFLIIFRSIFFVVFAAAGEERMKRNEQFNKQLEILNRALCIGHDLGAFFGDIQIEYSQFQ